ncbi:MAG: efflux RND transporter periplasmic adaptor subunit [Lachnospiraceae bacterium]|nr:efflux RND transporter periplasmic adaptor subunit [Lachnospiraceae bacterium]
MKKFYSRLIVISLTGILSLLSISGCSLLQGKEEEEPTEAVDDSIEVKTSNPFIRTISIESNFSGTVEAEDTVRVIPKVAGEVIEKHFEVGDHVVAGDLLFKMDDESARLQLDNAKATLDSANAGLTAQQATNASTKAQATETIAKISSNEAQLDYAVDSAYAQKRSAGNNFENAVNTEEYFEYKYEEAKDDLHDMKKKKKKLKQQKESISSTISSYKSRVNSDGVDKANEWLRGQGYSSANELESAYSSVSSAYEGAKSSIDGYEDTIRKYEMMDGESYENTADSAEMSYYTAEENVALAQQNRDIYRNFTKATTLFGVNAQVVGADASLVNSEVNVRQAKVGVENAQMNLDNYTVTSPVSGTITNIGVSLYNMATSATEAYTIETDSPNKIVFYVSEETMHYVEVGNKALITKNGTDYSARVTDVGTTVDPDKGLFKVEAVVQTGGTALLNGSTVSIRTVTRESKNAFTLPVDCIYFDGEQAYVLISEGDRAVRRDIVTGISDEEGIEVTSGLSPDDNVIVTWSSMLKDGAEIKVTGTEKYTMANTSGNKNAAEKKVIDPASITAGSATIEAASDELYDGDEDENKAEAE